MINAAQTCCCSSRAGWRVFLADLLPDELTFLQAPRVFRSSCLELHGLKMLVAVTVRKRPGARDNDAQRWCCRGRPVCTLRVNPHHVSRAHLDADQASTAALTTSGPARWEQIPHGTGSYFQPRTGEFSAGGPRCFSFKAAIEAHDLHAEGHF